MQRRSFLWRVGGSLLAGGTLAGRVGADDRETATPTPTRSPTPTFTPARTTPVAEGTEPLGSLPLPELKEVVTSPDGRTAYAATTDGFAVVDIDDPADPAVLFAEDEPLADREAELFDVYDVNLDGPNDLLAVVGPANPVDEGVFRGLVVYDVADRTAPERVAVHETGFFNHNCFAANGHVYLCGNTGDRNALVVVEAETGTEVGRWSIADVDERWRDVRFGNWVLHDVSVHGETAYLAHWDAGTWAVDVGDPASPELLAKIRGREPTTFAAMTGSEANAEALEPPGNDHYVATDETGDLLAVGVEAWDADPGDDEGGPGGITLYDVRDPADARELAVVEPPPTPDPTFDGVWTTAHNFAFRGDRLYTSWYRGGVRVYDVRDPTDPTLLARWRDSHGTSFWTARPAGDRDVFVAAARKRRDDGNVLTADAAALYTFRDPAPSDADDGGRDDGPLGDWSPGFGPLVGLAGLGAGAWYALRRRRDR